MFDDAESDEEIKDSANDSHEKLNIVLSEKHHPELFHCILNMMNDYNMPHKSNKYLKQDELDQITILFHNKEDSYFENFNPVKGDFSIIFKYLRKIKNISMYSFNSCFNLIKINIPDSVTEIGGCCFNNCIKLNKINLPDSVTEIGDYCFCNCQNLKEINIPKHITEIGYKCFFNCQSLTEINLPSSITKIDEDCFFNCQSLTEINIPDSIVTLRKYCFNKCENLEKISVPKKFKKYVKLIFSNIDLKKVKITYT